MEQRTATRDQVYFEKLDKIIEAMDKTAHRLNEINGTLGRIHFYFTEGTKDLVTKLDNLYNATSAGNIHRGE